jgi:hypothetical protein
MVVPEEINADMLAFWNGKGGHTWVARQEHTDITLTPVTDALLHFAAPRAGERVARTTHAGVCARAAAAGIRHFQAESRHPIQQIVFIQRGGGRIDLPRRASAGRPCQ